MSDNSRSKTIMFWILLLIHSFLGLQLFVLWVFFVPTFSDLFARLAERGELPLLTEYVLFSSANWYWIFPFGFVLDAAVLYALSRSPGKGWWPILGWFLLVLGAIGVLFLLTVAALLLPMVKMSETI